jgi:Trypsin
MRRRDFIKVIVRSAAAWQLAAIAQLDGAAMAVDAVTDRSAVMVYNSRGACNGAVLAQDLVLTAAHCIVGKDNLKIVGSINDTLYSLADVAAAEPYPRYIGAPVSIPDMALLRLTKPLPMPFGPALLITRPVAVGDRLEVVGRLRPVGSETSTESAAVFAVASVDRYRLRLVGEVSRLGGCYGFSGAPVFAIGAGIPQLAAIVRGSDCDSYLAVVPITPFRDWLAETAKRLGSPFAP